MSKRKPIRLTTYDNPFSPFSQFDEWYQQDIMLGYDTLGVLSRMTMVSERLSIEDRERIEHSAMVDLVKLLPETYKIVLEEDYT